jgi:DNA-binding transcriptional regulator YiaG
MEQKLTDHEAFSARASATLGGRGWQAKTAQALGVDASTIRRWVSGAMPVPTYAWAILELLENTPAAFRPPRWL